MPVYGEEEQKKRRKYPSQRLPMSPQPPLATRGKWRLEPTAMKKAPGEIANQYRRAPFYNASTEEYRPLYGGTEGFRKRYPNVVPGNLIPPITAPKNLIPAITPPENLVPPIGSIVPSSISQRTRRMAGEAGTAVAGMAGTAGRFLKKTMEPEREYRPLYGGVPAVAIPENLVPPIGSIVPSSISQRTRRMAGEAGTAVAGVAGTAGRFLKKTMEPERGYRPFYGGVEGFRREYPNVVPENLIPRELAPRYKRTPFYDASAEKIPVAQRARTMAGEIGRAITPSREAPVGPVLEYHPGEDVRQLGATIRSKMAREPSIGPVLEYHPGEDLRKGAQFWGRQIAQGAEFAGRQIGQGARLVGEKALQFYRYLNQKKTPPGSPAETPVPDTTPKTTMPDRAAAAVGLTPAKTKAKPADFDWRQFPAYETATGGKDILINKPGAYRLPEYRETEAEKVRPIEVLRGNTMTYFDPKTTMEFVTPQEAVAGKGRQIVQTREGPIMLGEEEAREEAKAERQRALEEMKERGLLQRARLMADVEREKTKVPEWKPVPETLGIDQEGKDVTRLPRFYNVHAATPEQAYGAGANIESVAGQIKAAGENKAELKRIFGGKDPDTLRTLLHYTTKKQRDLLRNME